MGEMSSWYQNLLLLLLLLLLQLQRFVFFDTGLVKVTNLMTWEFV